MFGYIYLITNTINKKQYVGQHTTDNLNDGYMGSGVALHRAFDKYGIENFTKEILFYTTSKFKENLKTILNPLETLYIKRYNTFFAGYNLTTGGDSYILSEESKERMSDSMKGNNNRLGKSASEDTKRRISLSQRGNSNRLGKLRSEESKRKQGESNRGTHRVWNAEHTKFHFEKEVNYEG